MTEGEQSPLVSIVMPAFNASVFIDEAVESVQAQSLTGWELLVVDDVSTDSTVDIVKRYALRDPRIRCFQQPRRMGPAAARNRAIGSARGRFIAFLDADDAWLPMKLERQLAFMEERKAGFSFTAYERINALGRSMGTVGVPPQVTYGQLLRTPFVGCLTAMYDRKVFGTRLMPDVPRRQDYALWLDLLREGAVGYGLNTVLARYRMGHTSVSSNKWKAAVDTWRVYRHVERLSLPLAVYVFMHYALGGVLRHRFPGVARRLGVLHEPDAPINVSDRHARD